jgi:hypothetical protein
MTKLEKIVKEAQKLRKAHPKKYAKWTDYIKAASKSIAGYTGTKKSGSTTTVNYTRKTAIKKSKPATQAKLFGARKTTIKTIGDTSGQFFIDQLKSVSNKIKSLEAGIMVDQKQMKAHKEASMKTFFRNHIKRKRAHISNLKKQITIIKKSIK